MGFFKNSQLMKEILQSSVQKLDVVIWLITVAFFVLSAIFLGGVVWPSILWAIGIIVLMFFVGLSIELILAALKHVKWLGTITGFITNGPEALVLIVWLIWGNVLFAASTPLGSNVMNPILLFIALCATWVILKLKDFQYKSYFLSTFALTAILAIWFFRLPEAWFIIWWIVAGTVWIILFRKKFDYAEENTDTAVASKLFLPLGIIILLISWYFLDPIVGYTAEVSQAPKWVIWFLVLATLTSWPEFKSVLSLLNKWKVLDGFVNIFVSNITNIWLASIGIVIWFLTQYV